MLTDNQPALVSSLSALVQHLGWDETVSVASYAWGEPWTATSLPVTLILGADCLYSHYTTGAFLDALDLLADATTSVLLSCEERWRNLSPDSNPGS